MKTAMQLVYDLVKSGLGAEKIVDALLVDEKLLIKKEKEIILDFVLKYADERVEKIAYYYDRTFNVSEKMKTPIEMLNAIIQMQEANYGRGSDTHMALNELAKEAKEVVKSYTANEIQLPSEKEIILEAKRYEGYEESMDELRAEQASSRYHGFIKGVKWIKERITLNTNEK
jgi:hypothetical protein